MGGDVLYNSDSDIGGFQFLVDGTTASAANGGDAAAAGFTVSTGGSTVLGFSFLVLLYDRLWYFNFFIT